MQTYNVFLSGRQYGSFGDRNRIGLGLDLPETYIRFIGPFIGQYDTDISGTRNNILSEPHVRGVFYDIVILLDP